MPECTRCGAQLRSFGEAHVCDSLDGGRRPGRRGTGRYLEDYTGGKVANAAYWQRHDREKEQQHDAGDQS